MAFELVLILIIAGGMILGALAGYYKSKQELYEVFKKLGIKTLALLAFINIFNFSNDKLHDNSSNSKPED